MSTSNEESYDDLIIDLDDILTIDSSSSSSNSDLLKDFLESLNANEDLPCNSTFSLGSSNIYTRIPSEFSPESSSDSNIQYSPSGVPQSVDASSLVILQNPDNLEIIAQPYQSSKLRYRTDYIREKKRLGVLHSKNQKSKTKGPAVKIPKSYLNPNDEYYIRVCLVTIKHKKTNLHYFHPYELENPCNEQLNDRQNNAVWFPIKPEDSVAGTKSFPFLRIVKKKGLKLLKCDHLRVFDCHGQNVQNEFFPGREIDFVKEYNLESSHLAFTIGKKQTVDGHLSMVLYAHTTVLSEEMCEDISKQSDTDSESESTSDKSASSKHSIYKYAPRSGCAASNEEVLVFLRKKLESRKYGDLQVTVEWDTSNGHWSKSVLELEIKERMISFKTPIFPYPITKTMPVDIILRQNNRIFGVLKYSYLSVSSC